MIPLPRFLKRGVMRYVFTCVGIIFTLIQTAQFAVYFGNLGSRVTLNFFANTSEALQNITINGTNLGWSFAYLIGAVIMIGPMDYYWSLDNGNAVDLILTLLGIYFVASYFIGMNVKRSMKRGENENYNKLLLKGFLLGFFAIVIFNTFTYLLITQLSNYFSDIEGLDSVQLIANAILSGVYGEDPSLFLVRGAVLNGTIFGIFGMFSTALMLPNKAKYSESHNQITVECDLNEDICYLSEDLVQLHDSDMSPLEYDDPFDSPH